MIFVILSFIRDYSEQTPSMRVIEFSQKEEIKTSVPDKTFNFFFRQVSNNFQREESKIGTCGVAFANNVV